MSQAGERLGPTAAYEQLYRRVMAGAVTQQTIMIVYDAVQCGGTGIMSCWFASHTFSFSERTHRECRQRGRRRLQT